MTQPGQQSEEAVAAAASVSKLRTEANERSGAVAAAHSAFIQQSQGTIEAINEAAGAAQAAGNENDPTKVAHANNHLTAKLQAAHESASKLKNAAGALAIAAQPSDPRYEWDECRKTIDRFDKLLVDLRKTGFGVIATIFSAAAILFAYAPTATTVPLQLRVKVAIFIVIGLLIVSTYCVDRVHQIWLEVAVDRAKCLECKLGFKITQKTSERFSASRAGLIWPSLYCSLLFMGWLIFAMSLRVKWTDGHQTFLFQAFMLAVASIIVVTFYRERRGIRVAHTDEQAHFHSNLRGRRDPTPPIGPLVQMMEGLARKRSVYLAGPAVFRFDAAEYGAALKQRCGELGLEPLWPLDNKPPAASSRAAFARLHREMNCDMIHKADAVIADISPFRGPNMDPGTAFEIGYAAALGKPIFLYSDTPDSLLDRTAASHRTQSVAGKLFDEHNMEVEDFGLTENLMISTSVDHVFASAEEALIACSKAGIK